MRLEGDPRFGERRHLLALIVSCKHKSNVSMLAETHRQVIIPTVPVEDQILVGVIAFADEEKSHTNETGYQPLCSPFGIGYF